MCIKFYKFLAIYNKMDLVIAYYKEDLSWLNEYKDIPFRKIFIYNKGTTKPKTALPFTEIKLPNVGRCDHTYLYHIIHEYNDLAPVTIFTTASLQLSHKKRQFDFTLRKVQATNNTVMLGASYNDVAKEFHGFYRDTWQSTDKNNREDTSKDILHKSAIRPFGKWYESTFNKLKISFVTYGGVFAVSKAHIHHHGVRYYQSLIDQFPNHSNPEVGHYFERAWVAIFHPIPHTCLYSENDIETSNKNTLLIGLLLISATIYIFHESISKYFSGLFTSRANRSRNYASR